MSENGPRSKQGTLFKQIRETEFADIPLQTFIDYAGFKRGIETFLKIIERENRTIPTDFDDESTAFWNTKTRYETANLEMLMFAIGSMNTPRSFEVLMKFAIGDYHPFVRCEAVFGLTFDSRNFKEVRRLAVRLIQSPRHQLDIYSGLLVFDHLFYRFKGPKAVEFLAPLLDHTNGHVRAQTAYVLGYWPEGKVRLAQYREGWANGQ